MKKISAKLLVVLLVVVLCMALITACGKKDGSGDTEPEVTMTESYEKARNEFKAVTGIELPALADLVIEEAYPYQAGATSYEVDITAGDNLSRETFDAMVTFLDTALSGWTKENPSQDGPYTNVWYASAAGRIGITWDSENVAIYVHAVMGNQSGGNSGNEQGNGNTENGNGQGNGNTENGNGQGNTNQGTEQGNGNTNQGNEQGNPDQGNEQGNGQDQPAPNMTASYERGRNGFHEISGIWLPELTNVELDADSSFDTQKKSAELVVPSGADTFTSIVNAVKTALRNEPLSDNNNHWEQDGIMAFWEWDYEAGGRMHKVTIQLENNTHTGKITAGYWFRDYYTLTLTAGEGGAVTLEIAGRGQEGNTAHVVYNTASELTATPDVGYAFAGFYEGNTQLSAVSPYRYMIVKDVTVEARFRKLEGYEAAKSALQRMSGIVLPDLTGVTMDEEHSVVTFDPAGLRDEFSNAFTFTTAQAATEAYAAFKTAINAVEGNPEETMEGMDIWSVLRENGTVPYRDDVMMNVYEATINLLWRKQPIVYYSVSVEGEGSAYIAYTTADYQEHRVQRYWEIADAFHGKLVAEASDGYEFAGWYVNGASVSNQATFYFGYEKEDVDFTTITFTARFDRIVMTDSYATARASFQTATGLTLPVLSGVTGMFEDLGSDMYMVDIGGASQNTLTSVISAFDNQTNTASEIDSYGKNVWKFTRTDNDATCEVSAFYAEGIVVVMYTEEAESSMTESYAAGRTAFATITGFTLPELADCELLESSDLRTNQHTVACFDISGTADDLAEIIDCLQEQIGHAPARSDASGAIWLVDACFGDVWYGGQVDVMIDTDADPVAIYVNYSVGEADESYLCAQEFFAMATGVELPLRSGLIGSICVTGDLMFDITDGDGRSQYEYELFEAFFDRTIPGWTKDAPAEADRDYTEGYTNINYTTTGCAINFVWDAENQGIYLNVMQVRDDFAPLPRIYEIIEKNFDVIIPEIENVALSMFTYDNNDITLNVGGAGFTYDAYLSLEAAFTDALGAMEEDFPTGNEESGRDAQWKANGYWFSTTWAPAGINPYTELPYDASYDVNISLLP